MSKPDWTKYKNHEEIVEDIKSIKIQGATNVAIACFEGLKLFLKNYDDDVSYEKYLSEVEKVGVRLMNARPNEPLAKNGVKYILNMLRIQSPGLNDTDLLRQKLNQLADEYLEFIDLAKDKIVDVSSEIFDETIDDIFTHCHSSTAERVIIGHERRHDESVQVVCTETRPLYQGRITAQNLLDHGLDTTLIADSASESFIIGRGNIDPDVIFIGCDEITMQGDAINKIGSWGVAHAAYFANKPVYVVTSILKVDVTTSYRPVEIEMREAREIWEEAPKGLKMVNPSFELVNKEFITGYITECGVIKPDDIADEIQQKYQWLF